ncbi:cytochrome P450 89A2-like [Impatiens glandulifera]|uniref:cytochrome P450 89A2-like n=1 Tax=Impatiens glandulifera TaxID=253017 RepID=UPI001FB12F2C|nr:cytochrome P450 89A2-like [Impatiens glandulifera]
MEIWFIIVVTLCVAALIRSISDVFISSNPVSSKKKTKKLPPGPPSIPIIGTFLLLRKSFQLEPIIKNLKLKYGPLLALRFGSSLSIFIADRSLAHQALIEKGAIFSDRPDIFPIPRLFSSNQKNINSSSYGPTWRLLRRNLTSEILNPSRVKSYTHARKWVLTNLLIHLNRHSSDDLVVPVIKDLQYAMFCLLVLMCFGDKLEEEKIKEIEEVERELIMNFTKFNVINFFPKLGSIIFHKRWQQLTQIRQRQEDVIIPLIKARREFIQSKKQKQSTKSEAEAEAETVAYIDTLIDLELLEDEKRRLNDSEIVALCNEFLNAGTDTASTALQWIMANLVKYPTIQTKLYDEISGIMGPPEFNSFEREINEKDLQGMSYLKAVVLEGLRLHPPGHFVLPHKVTEDVELNGYLVPKEARVNFMVAEIGRDPAVWEQPMEFKPERFIIDNGGKGYELVDTDITGSKEIKMMPFGVGRRMCPGMGLALLHMEYFLANLVWNFEWIAIEGDEVDMSEKQEFTVIMEKPLQTKLKPRSAPK